MDKKPDFQVLVETAKSKSGEIIISPFIKVGGVSAALLTTSGNIYVGVCIDTSCSLGMCAERNAIANMLTNGESNIEKLVCYFENGTIGIPCGACREYLMQLDDRNGELDILVDAQSMKSVKLKSLLPEWWGNNYYSNSNEKV